MTGPTRENRLKSALSERACTSEGAVALTRDRGIDEGSARPVTDCNQRGGLDKVGARTVPRPGPPNYETPQLEKGPAGQRRPFLLRNPPLSYVLEPQLIQSPNQSRAATTIDALSLQDRL